MKKLFKLIAIVAGLGILVIVLIVALMPWIGRWGATKDEVAASYVGDELVQNPRLHYTRAISINATPQEIYPWIVQLGAERGGMYSYSWFETNILRCELINADRIHEEWQDLKVGDQVKICPTNSGPPPYEVAIIDPNRAIVLGHQENGRWVEVWQFILFPQTDGSTRLVLRSRSIAEGWFWDIIRPGEFIMARGMLLGIKERAESMGGSETSSLVPPEVFNPLDPSPTPSDSDLPLTCQITDLNIYVDTDAGYCFAFPKAFTYGTQPIFVKQAAMGPGRGSTTEPIFATFIVETAPYNTNQSLDGQVDDFLREFTVAAPESMMRARLTVSGESAVMVDVVPVHLSWRIVFVPHDGQLYRLMYWPVDLPETKTDIEDLYQTSLNSFAFLPEK